MAWFPSRQEQVRAELEPIDREIEDELDHSAIIVPRSVTPSASEAQACQALDGPLLSHHDVMLRKMIGSGLMGKVYEAWQL